MRLNKTSGFTLVELLVTIGLVSLLVGLGVPSLSAIVQNNVMTAGVNDLVATMLLARSEAVKRRAPVVICHSESADAEEPACDGTGWQQGWLVFADADDDRVRDAGEEVLRASTGLGKNLLVQVAAGDGDPSVLVNSMTFLPSGFPRAIGSGNLLVCDGRASNHAARVINVSQTGRAQVRAYEDVPGLTVSCEE